MSSEDTGLIKCLISKAAHRDVGVWVWVDGFKCIWLILKSGAWTGGTCGLVDQIYIYIRVLLSFIAPFNFLLCFKAEMV